MLDHILQIADEQFDVCPSLNVLGDPHCLRLINKADYLCIQTGIMLGRQIMSRESLQESGVTELRSGSLRGKVAVHERLSFRLFDRFNQL